MIDENEDTWFPRVIYAFDSLLFVKELMEVERCDQWGWKIQRCGYFLALSNCGKNEWKVEKKLSEVEEYIVMDESEDTCVPRVI